MRTIDAELSKISHRVPHRIIRAAEVAEEVLLDAMASIATRKEAAAFLRQERERFVAQVPAVDRGYHALKLHNERLRARREEMAQLRVDLLAKVQRLRAILGEPLS